MSYQEKDESRPLGIETRGVAAWFAGHIAGSRPPLTFTLVAGGRSNLTYLVSDAAQGRYVLRRPPVGLLLPKAHDVAREHRIIAALEHAGVPVPRPLGLCEDPEVTGAPFYVMEFVDGVIARSEGEVEEAFSEPQRWSCAMALVDTLARIHEVDPAAVGLGDLGRHDGYVSRQLGRWFSNYQSANAARRGEPLELMQTLHARLAAAVPTYFPASVVHGDFKLDNCIVSSDGDRVLAVLDWELCTLGDPLADLGTLLVYWPEAGELTAAGTSRRGVTGFPSREELVERYAQLTNRDVSGIDYYVSFAYWKLACITEGVYARYIGGAMGDDGFDVSRFSETMTWLVNQSDQAAARAGI